MKNNYFYKKPLSNIYKKPNVVSEVTSQILYGEKFKIISKNKNWIKIKVSFDNYTGYIKNKDHDKDHKPTHKIFVLKANIYNKQKNKTKYFLPFASRISIIQENKNFIEFEKSKWIKKNDVKKIDHIEKDYSKVLKLFLKIKYFLTEAKFLLKIESFSRPMVFLKESITLESWQNEEFTENMKIKKK